LKVILQKVPDPRGKQGQDYMLWSILSLVIVGLLCGRRGLKAAFLLGRAMTARQRNALGFMNGTTPCRTTLTETMRAIDARALADILGALDLAEGNDARHIAIDGKTMRASKDREGKAVHVLSAFCSGLHKVMGHAASRGKGMEIPDALKLLEQLDLTGKIVTGDACSARNRSPQRSSNAAATTSCRSRTIRKICARTLKRLSTSRFSPLSRCDGGVEKAHGRIERRIIDVLPAKAVGISDEWPTVRQICRLQRSRQIKKNGQWQQA
jgi:predicted transposase YbfD/YdcC